MTWAFKLVGMYHELVLRKLCIMKTFPSVGCGFARMNCFFTADDVLVPAVTVQIVSCCHGPVLASMVRTNLVCSILTQLWRRTFLLDTKLPCQCLLRLMLQSRRANSELPNTQSVSERKYLCSSEAIEYFCHWRNIQDKLTGRKSLTERKVGSPFDGPVIRFEADF